MPSVLLTRGDSRPNLVLTLTNKATDQPFDVSDPGTTVHFQFREVGSTVLKFVATCVKVPGRLLPNGTIDSAAPFDVPGRGGRVQLFWPTNALDRAGYFESEVDILFADGTKQTAVQRQTYNVREAF